MIHCLSEVQIELSDPVSVCYLGKSSLLGPGHTVALQSDMDPATWSLQCLVWGFTGAGGQADQVPCPLPSHCCHQPGDRGPVWQLVRPTPTLCHSHSLALNRPVGSRGRWAPAAQRLFRCWAVPTW